MIYLIKIFVAFRTSPRCNVSTTWKLESAERHPKLSWRRCGLLAYLADKQCLIWSRQL